MCVRLVKTEMKKTEVRVCDFRVAELLWWGWHSLFLAQTAFVWRNHIGNGEQKLVSAAHLCTSILSVGMKHRTMIPFAEMGHYVNVPEVPKEKSKSGSSAVMIRHPHMQAHWDRRKSRCLHLDPTHSTWGWPSCGCTASKYLHVGTTRRPAGHKFPEGRSHCLAAHFLMAHFPCSTLRSLTASSVWCGFSSNTGSLIFVAVQDQMLPVGPHIWQRYSSEVYGGCSPADALKLLQGVKPL